jgi:hypothetical protein
LNECLKNYPLYLIMRKSTRRNKTIRMKKSDYLREHHHLFKVLSRPTRKVLARELKIQKKELKERGFKG